MITINFKFLNTKAVPYFEKHVFTAETKKLNIFKVQCCQLSETLPE